MKVTVIGCSPAWPNAGGAQSGYLVEGAGGHLLLDCGPGVLARLRNGNGGWPNVDAIAITHFHLDHWGDLVPWTFGAAFGPGRREPKPDGSTIMPGSVIRPSRGRRSAIVAASAALRRARSAKLSLSDCLTASRGSV